MLSRIRRCVGHPPWVRSFRGPRRRWQGRSGIKMAAAAELGALGRRWLCWLLGLQAVRADPARSRSGLSAAAAPERGSGCEGGEGGLRRVPGREARTSPPAPAAVAASFAFHVGNWSLFLPSS